MGSKNTFILKPKSTHSATVIFLHGLGDTGEGWSEAFSSDCSKSLPHVKFIFPTASVQPVTLNMGMPMPSWFDIQGLTPQSAQDQVGIHKSRDLLRGFIDSEIQNGISANKIVIGGFSQGGAVSIYTAVTEDCPDLAGILLLSCWMPLHSKFPEAFQRNKGTPMLQCHGTDDPLVPFTWGQETAKLISSINSKHKFKSFSGLGHSSSPQEMKDVLSFLMTVIPPASS